MYNQIQKWLYAITDKMNDATAYTFYYLLIAFITALLASCLTILILLVISSFDSVTVYVIYSLSLGSSYLALRIHHWWSFRTADEEE